MPSVRAPAGGRSRPPIAVDAPPETLSFEESLLLIFPSFGRRVPAAGQCGRPRKRPRVSSGPPGLRGPGGRGLTPLGCCLSLGAEDGGGDVVVGAESFEQVTVSSFFLLDCSLPSLSRQRCHLLPSFLPSLSFPRASPVRSLLAVPVRRPLSGQLTLPAQAACDLSHRKRCGCLPLCFPWSRI